jgi:hypothetical protein
VSVEYAELDRGQSGQVYEGCWGFLEPRGLSTREPGQNLRRRQELAKSKDIRVFQHSRGSLGRIVPFPGNALILGKWTLRHHEPQAALEQHAAPA